MPFAISSDPKIIKLQAMNLYREEILDHNENPRNFGKLEDADALASKANVSCGDSLELFVKLGNKDGKRVVNKMNFIGVGCALSIASASMLSEKVVGKGMNEIKEMDEKFMMKMMGAEISSGRMKCVMLALEALKTALKI